MSAPLLRPATREDIPAIEKLLNAESLPLFDFPEYLDTFWVLEDDEGTAGCIGVEIYGEAAVLRSIVTTPRIRGTGLGMRLTNHVLAEAKERGAKRVYLFTLDKGPFFAKMGFRKIAFDDFEPAARRCTQWRSVNAGPAAVRDVLTYMRRDVP